MELVLTVTDVKNYAYCPRVVYHHYYLRHRPLTFKMIEGKIEHVRQEDLEERRLLKRYGLEGGQRFLSVPLYSAALGLSGILDQAIVTADEVVVLEFKNTGQGVPVNHQMQLMAYGLLAEERWQRPCRRGIVYLVTLRQRREVTLTAALRQRVQRSLTAMRQMIQQETFPPPTARRGRCLDCEFRRYCNDID